MSSCPTIHNGTHRQEEEDEKDDIVELFLLGPHDRSVLLILLVVPLRGDWSGAALVAVGVGRLRWVWLCLSIWSRMSWLG